MVMVADLRRRKINILLLISFSDFNNSNKQNTKDPWSYATKLTAKATLKLSLKVFNWFHLKKMLRFEKFELFSNVKQYEGRLVVSQQSFILKVDVMSDNVIKLLRNWSGMAEGHRSKLKIKYNNNKGCGIFWFVFEHFSKIGSTEWTIGNPAEAVISLK